MSSIKISGDSSGSVSLVVPTNGADQVVNIGDLLVSTDLAASTGATLVGTIQSGTGAVARTVDVELKERVSVKQFGAVGDGSTDDTLKIKAAILAVYLQGGGEIYFPVGTYVVSDTIVVPQRVTLVGVASGFVNQYYTGEAAPKGSVLYLKTGSNVDVVKFQLSVTIVGGIPTDTTLGWNNRDFRHFGGMRNMTIWGNRSTTADPTVKDNNTTGYGISIFGCRYVKIHSVQIMYCAQDGLYMERYNYGTGVIYSNNQQLSNISSLSNAGNGFYIRGGDCIFTNLNGGYNALKGIDIGCSGIFTGGLFWNNKLDGCYLSELYHTGGMSFSAVHSYDNDRSGFRILGENAPLLSGCYGRGNGRNVALLATDRANFYVYNTARNWNLSNCTSEATDQDNVLITQYGYYILNPTYAGTIDGSTDHLSATPYYVQDYSNLLAHGGITTPIYHPPINFNAGQVKNVGLFSFWGWETVTAITSNTVVVGTKSLITLNCTGVQTINDISYSDADIPLIIIRNISTDAVTFTANSATLRLKDGLNVVLGQHESISFAFVAGTVWQQVSDTAGAISNTYTPTIIIGGASTGISYTTQTGNYTRNGNTVTFNCNIVLSSKGVLTGAVTLVCLPVASTSSSALASQCTALTIGVGDTMLSAITASSGTGVVVSKIVNGNATPLIETDIKDTSAFKISGTYFI